MDPRPLFLKYRIPPSLLGKEVLVDEEILREHAHDDVIFPFAFPGLIFRFTGGIALEDDPRLREALRSEYPHVDVRGNPLAFPPGEHLFVEAPPQHVRPILLRGMELGFPEISGVFRESVGIHLVAEPGWREYSPLSVLATLFYEVEAYRLPADAFYPHPRGSMAEFRMKRKREYPRIKEFHAFLRRLFSEKRRKLSTLLPHAPDTRVFQAPPEMLLELFETTLG